VPEGKRRTLHVVGGLDRAGVETWLMHMLRNIDRDRYQFDFLVHGEKTYDYEEEAVALGARVIRCIRPRNWWAYARRFRRILKEFGPYDVVHAHVQYFNGWVLRLAHQEGVPIRIAHSHLDTRAIDAGESATRRAYLWLSRRWIEAHSTLGLTVSGTAAQSLFLNTGLPIQLLPCAVDPEPFTVPVSSEEVRNRLGIPLDAVVIGHVGRFEDAKNHDLLVRIAHEFMRLEPRGWLLLVGQGKLRDAVESQCVRLNIRGRTTFAGSTPEVPTLMRGAMEVFVFPSVYEGLPLALIEAQGAGLSCMVSDAITTEADIRPDLITRMALSAPIAMWAERLLEIIQFRNRPYRISHDAVLLHYHFDLSANVNALCGFYSDVEQKRTNDRLGAAR